MKTYISMLLVAGVMMGVSLPAQAQQQETVSAPQVLAQATSTSAIAQQFVETMAAGNFAGALQMYDPVVQQNLTQASLQLNWQTLIDESGAFQTVVSSETVSTGDSSIVIVTCTFAGGEREIFVSLTPENQVVSFSAVSDE